MWMMLQQEKPDDFVVATGEAHSVREFVQMAFDVIGRKITWSGTGTDEIGTDQNGNVVVRVDPSYFRPTEVELLLGDPTKARQKLGWETKISLKEMCKEMVEADLKETEETAHLKKRRVLAQTEA